MNNRFFCKIPKASIRLSANHKSEKLKEILYGEQFIVKKKVKDYYFGFTENDKYQGFIKRNHLTNQTEKADHIIIHDKTRLFRSNNINSKLKGFLYLNSKVKVFQKKKLFSNIGKYWIENKNLCPLTKFKNNDFFKNLKTFKKTKYVWGGNTSDGIDCSGLVQELMKSINQKCPRDSKDQLKFYKHKVSLKDIKKGDLLFWKGHVAIAINKNELIHAYGPRKKVVVMKLNKVIQELEKKSLKLLSIKRPKK